MPETPLISIVIPSYNQAAYLEHTLRSVLEQNFPGMEVLVVDGGSNDGSVEIIRRYAGRLAWWISEKDRGQADGINKGLARARGEFIAWLNSDDLYLPGAVATAVRALEDDPARALVFGDVLAIDAAGETTNVMRYGSWGLDELMRFYIIGQPGVFLRREALLRAGPLDENYHYLLDHHLWLRVAQQGDMHYLPTPLAAARFHAAAKNVAQAAAFGQEAYRIVAWMQAQPALAGRFSRNRRKIWAGAHRMNARYLLDGGQPGPALRAYLRSLANHPPTALAEAHRMAYAAASLLVNVDGLRAWYLRRRKARISNG